MIEMGFAEEVLKETCPENLREVDDEEVFENLIVHQFLKQWVC